MVQCNHTRLMRQLLEKYKISDEQKKERNLTHWLVCSCSVIGYVLFNYGGRAGLGCERLVLLVLADELSL